MVKVVSILRGSFRIPDRDRDINKTKCNFFIEHTDRLALEIIKRRLEFGPNV